MAKCYQPDTFALFIPNKRNATFLSPCLPHPFITQPLPAPASPDSAEPPDLAPTTACILSLHYVMQASTSFDPSGRPSQQFDPWDEETDGSAAPPLLPPTPHLLVATPRALSLIDCHTYEVLQAHFLGAEAVAPAVAAAAEGAACKGGRVRRWVWNQIDRGSGIAGHHHWEMKCRVTLWVWTLVQSSE